MFEELKQRLAHGLSLVRQGGAIVAEVRENIADGRAALAEIDLDELNRMLDEVTAESEALSARIQRA